MALNLASAEDVRGACDAVLANARRHAPAARILGVLVQPMAAPGREIILGIKRDPTFGPMLMVGLGGVAVEVLKDVALAPVPLGDGEARAMLARLKGAPLLEAHRGAPAADIDALVALMVRLGPVRVRSRRNNRGNRSQPGAGAPAGPGCVGGGCADRLPYEKGLSARSREGLGGLALADL